MFLWGGDKTLKEETKKTNGESIALSSASSGNRGRHYGVVWRWNLDSTQLWRASCNGSVPRQTPTREYVFQYEEALMPRDDYFRVNVYQAQTGASEPQCAPRSVRGARVTENLGSDAIKKKENLP